MNFARDVVDRRPTRPARRWSSWRRDGSAPRVDASARWPTPPPAWPAPSAAAASAAATSCMTLIGNRPEWVLTMVACFRLGAVALPCNEQLRAKDLRHAPRRRRARR